MPKDKKSISDDEFKKFLEPVASPEIIGQLNDWAHAGTKEALNKLEKFIKDEKDEKLRGYAECALEECQYFYYSPNNEKEEKDFLLAKMTKEKEERIFDLEGRAEAAKIELDRLKLDKRINEKISEYAKGAIKGWKNNYSEDYKLIVENKLAEINDEIEYLEAWVMAAKKIISATKYSNMLEDYLDHIHSEYDGVDFWGDEPLEKEN